ncbi:MAG: hypothetical protein R3E10_10175 [Gemmatimonadota bacterium]
MPNHALHGLRRSAAILLLAPCLPLWAALRPDATAAQEPCAIRYQFARTDGRPATQTLSLAAGQSKDVNRVDLQRVTNAGSREIRIRITIPTGGTKWVSLAEGQADPPIANYIGSVTFMQARCMHLYESPVAMYTALVRSGGGYRAADETIKEFALEPAAFLAELQGHLELHQIGETLASAYGMTPPAMASALEQAGYPVLDAVTALRAVVEQSHLAQRWPPVLRQAYGDADAARATLQFVDGEDSRLAHVLYASGYTLSDLLKVFGELYPRSWDGAVAGRLLFSAAGQTNSYTRPELALALAEHFRADGREVTQWLVLGLSHPLRRPGDVARQAAADTRPTPARTSRSGAGRGARASRGGPASPTPSVDVNLAYGLVAEGVAALTDDPTLAFLWFIDAGLGYAQARDAVIHSDLELSPGAFAEGMRRADAPVGEAWTLLGGQVSGDGWDDFRTRGPTSTGLVQLAARRLAALTAARYERDATLALLAAEEFELQEKGALAEALRRGGYAGREAVAAIHAVHPEWSGGGVGLQFSTELEATAPERADVLSGLMQTFEVPREEALLWITGFKSGVVGALHGQGLDPVAILTLLAGWERDDWVGEGLAESVTTDVNSVAAWTLAARYPAERAAKVVRRMCRTTFTYAACEDQAHAEAATRALASAGYEHEPIRRAILALYGTGLSQRIDAWLQPQPKRRRPGR